MPIKKDNRINKSKQGLSTLLPIYFMLVLIVSGCFKIESWCLLLPLAFIVCKCGSGNEGALKCNYLDTVFLIICIAEIVLLCGSSYVPNSIVAFVNFMGAIVLWFFMRCFLTEEYHINVIVVVLLIASAFLSFLTLLHYLKHRSLFIDLGFDDLTAVRQYYRPLGELSNDWTSLLICLLPAPLVVFLKTGNKYLKFFCLVIFIAVNTSVLVSFSRGGYLSLFFYYLTALFITVLFYRKHLAKYLSIVFCSIALSVIVVLPDRESITTTLSMNKTTVQSRSTEGRLTKWKESLDLFKSKPYMGYGGGNYVLASTLHGNKQYETLSFRSTNSYLQLLVEKGIIGLVCFLIGAIAVFKIVIDSAKKSEYTIPFISAFVALTIHEFFFSSFFEKMYLPLLAVVYLYIIAYYSFRYEKE